MTNTTKKFIAYTAVTGLLAGVWATAADAEKSPIKEVMQHHHKAPKGTDPTCKKASEGTASADELKKLVSGYQAMAKAKAPKGDDASWKEKTGKLLAAAIALQKGAPNAVDQYKAAVNCKACHSVHKPD